MQIATGSYTGDGNDDRSITGIGFQPDLVVVKGDTTQRAVFRTATMAGDNTAVFSSDVALFADGIQALQADGFQVGTNATVNTNGVTYHYACFRDDGEGDFCEGSYVGNGIDNRDIAIGFTPTFAVVKSAGAKYATWRVNENANDDCLDFWNSANNTNMIQSFPANSIQVGGSDKVNSNGVTYYYFAFLDVAGYIETGTYTGNGNDDRSISGLGFQPNMVWVKGDVAEHAIAKIDQMPAGESGIFQPAALAANQIQAFEVDGFQIGTTNVNTLNEIYFWAAWKTGTTGADGVIIFRRRIEGY